MSLDRRTVIGLVCVILLVSTGQTSQKDPAEDMVIRVNVELVQVDATVTNSKGELVTDLKTEDFVILQDDKPQEITNFSFVRTREAVKRDSIVKKESPKETFLSPPPPPPLKREQVRRTIALVVDDFGIAFETMGQVRRSIKKWVDEEMQPNDLVALVMTGGGEGALQQFTNDKRILYAAINRVQYNAASRVGTTSLSGLSKSGNAEMERDMIYTTFTLQSIKQVVNGLKNLPGRKDLILFSESMNVMFETGPGVSQGRDLHMKQLLQETVDLANKWAVVIHAIDPRGVMGFMSAEDNFSEMAPEDIAAVGSQRSSQLTNSRDGMVKMAVETGGLVMQNRNNIDRALVTVVDDGDGYYLIGYQPDEKTIAEMRSGNARYHNIRVRVNRPGLHVRTRSRFFSTPINVSAPDLMARQERIEDAMRSPFTSGSMRVRLTALFSQTKEESPCINALLHFGVGQLTFSNEPDGWRKASIEIVAGLYDINGQQVEFLDKGWGLQVKGQSYENMRRNGVSFLMRLPVGIPGSYQMRLVLRDTKSGQLGSASQFIDIPDVRKNKLALSGIVLAGDQPKPKTAADQNEGMMEDSGSNKTAAVRVFEPGTEMSWAYQILNAKTDKNQQSKLQIQYRIFYEGREVFEKKPPEMTLTASGTVSKRMIAADQMKLVQLPPGYYVLQIAVADMLAEEKDRTVVQSIDFEVQNSSVGGKKQAAVF
jgi:VWFA-related protein